MPSTKTSFNAELAYSNEATVADPIQRILMLHFGARCVVKASVQLDKKGVDYLVELYSGRSLGVDIKVRRDDYREMAGRDDLALETYSVVETQKIGWTLDDAKLCDYVLWFWTCTHRTCLLPFPLLREVTKANLSQWKSRYVVRQQQTAFKDTCYHSEIIFVPRHVVRNAITQRFFGDEPEKKQKATAFIYGDEVLAGSEANR